MTATSLTDVFYVGRRLSGVPSAWAAVRACLDQLHLIAVGFNELRAAEQLGTGDFEDHVQIACASAAQLEAIVTRDPTGFANSPIPVWSPKELVQKLTATTQVSRAKGKRRKKANGKE